jgi:translocation and assembly module TamA
VFTAHKTATYTSDLRLARVIAVLLAFGAPGFAAAQSMSQADDELRALIPDSAVENADAWALDTEAAKTGTPPVTLIDEIEADTAMPDIPGMTIVWPDGSELPKIEPLSPDPDIEVAEQSTEAAVEALHGQEETDSGVGAKLVNADIARIGRQVELAFPRGSDAIAEKDAIVARFADFLPSNRSTPIRTISPRSSVVHGLTVNY